MFNEKEKKDLDLLVKTGEKQAGKLNSITITNYFVGFSTEKQTESINALCFFAYRIIII